MLQPHACSDELDAFEQYRNLKEGLLQAHAVVSGGKIPRIEPFSPVPLQLTREPLARLRGRDASDSHRNKELLQGEGIKGVQEYCEKLAPNWKTPAVYRDLLSEAYAALMFVRSSFGVTMRESPDLRLDRGGHTLGAEVKRFHRKLQDDIDDQRMQKGFTRYGDTVPTEGKEGWEQVAEVAEKKFS